MRFAIGKSRISRSLSQRSYTCARNYERYRSNSVVKLPASFSGAIRRAEAHGWNMRKEGKLRKEGERSVHAEGAEEKREICESRMRERTKRAAAVGETFVLERARIMFASDLMQESHKFSLQPLPKGVANKRARENREEDREAPLGNVSNLSNMPR